jgi:hypothetical protein
MPSPMPGGWETALPSRASLWLSEVRQENVRRISSRKGVYRTISGLLEDPVHTRLIPAIWLEFRKEGGSAG